MRKKTTTKNMKMPSNTDAVTCDTPRNQRCDDGTLSGAHFTERSEEKSISGHGKENTGHREH